MKVVILAGGLGTRLSEETVNIPKPMIEIGNKPILWHIMKIYSHYGFKDFIICAGYKNEIIKNYFNNFNLNNSDVIFDYKKNNKKFFNKNFHDWKVTVVDTGANTLTGGRLKRISNLLKNEKNFAFTYGDGVSNINLAKLVKFHQKQKKLVTVTAVRAPGRYGILNIDKFNVVKKFSEKIDGEEGYINGGFFILSNKVLELIEDDSTIWEQEPMKYLSSKNEIAAYKHNDFWQSMDTLRDKIFLNKLWDNNSAPWKIWKN